MARHIIRPADRGNFANQPRCRVCRRPANRGQDICYRHAGRGGGIAMAKPHRRAHSVLFQLEREGLIPPDLARLDVWQRARAQQRLGALRAKMLLERFCDREIDPSGWIRALRHAG